AWPPAGLQATEGGGMSRETTVAPLHAGHGPDDRMALHTRGLTKAFGALQVTRDVDFALPVGARHALIGPNGAGKTTFINLLTGTLAPTGGAIHLLGEDITGLRPDQRVKRGLVRTFQVTSLFPELTPLQSVTL